MCHTYTLNVGLREASAAEIRTVIDKAAECELMPHEFETHGDTLVVTVEPSPECQGVFGRVYELCRQLGRDAIAVADPWRGCGYVVGDRSALYGPFDPAKFKFLSPAP